MNGINRNLSFGSISFKVIAENEIKVIDKPHDGDGRYILMMN